MLHTQHIFFILKSFFWKGLWALGLFLVLSFSLRWLSGDRFLIVRFTNYFMPWLGIALIFALIIAAGSKKGYLAVLLFLPLILISQSYLPRFANCSNAAKSDGPTIKIMSYNVWEYNKNLSAVAKVIKQEKPDILLLQEIRSNGIQTIKNSLDKLYSNGILHIAYGPKIMQAVISRYAMKEIEASPEKARAQKVIINTPYGFISVINIHAYKYGWKHRHLQIKKLLEEEIIAEKGPLILGGDFNTNEQSQTYQMVNKYLQNAHWRVGCGFGFTYPASPSFIRKKFPILPMIRIDHIFYNNHLIKHSARTIYESGGSDHFPVIADFFFRPKP